MASKSLLDELVGASGVRDKYLGVQGKDGLVVSAVGPLARTPATEKITADSMKGDKPKEMEFVPLTRNRVDPETGAVIGKVDYRELFNEATKNAARVVNLRGMLTEENRKHFSATVLRNLERELKTRAQRKPLRLVEKCPVYVMAAMGERGDINLVGTKDDAGNNFHADPVYTVPSGVKSKGGVPRFVAESGVPECSILRNNAENVFVRVNGDIQQCVTPKCRTLIADVKRIKGEEDATASARLAKIFQALAAQGSGGAGNGGATLVANSKVIRESIGAFGTSSAADREFKIVEATRALEDAVRNVMIASEVDKGMTRVEAREAVMRNESDIKRHVEEFIKCANTFKNGVPSDEVSARNKCERGGSNKCTFYGKSVTTPGGARLPGICFSSEFNKNGASSSTMEAAKKAIKSAGDVMLAEKAKDDATHGRNITLGGGGGPAPTIDARMQALSAGTARLAAMARSLKADSISGGATSPYGPHSSTWAM